MSYKMKLAQEQKDTVRSLIGKTIKSIRLQPFDRRRYESEECEPPATDPEIVFTDGTRLGFSVDETEFGEYGVNLLFRDAKE